KEEIQTIKTLLKDSRTAKYHKRLQIVLFRLMGKSYKEIIELLDCNQTMIWRNVKKYEEFGLDSLLQETRGGRNHAYMTVEEEKVFLARHLKAAEAGEFVTIDALFQAYKKELGCSYTRDAFYQLLKRHGWRNITPHPEHPSNIGFTFIPPYTPEMNPIEQVWKEIRKRGFKNKAFRTLEDVMNQLQDVIQGLEKEVIKSIVNRRWTRMLFESR
ncbi:winged helix-turn-helix domain-containing protein, partial [Streptococcus pneumoniae]|nr:winged helix-turn-helix domain-containing protein [Streptococcus pneumoniae]